MSHDLWVVGGEQRVTFQEREPWRRFRTAVVARVRDGVATRVFTHQTPPELRAGEGSHCFKAATFTADRAYLCTDTEVLVCALPEFRLERVLSLPCFNDLHHVTPGPDGTLFVACTGLDAVAEITVEGELLRLVDVLGGSVWGRFSPDVDYRRVATTKPHHSHPNFIFFLGGEPWVTRFHQADAVPLSDPGRAPKRLSEHGIHDGNPWSGCVLFTGVDGRILGIDGLGERCFDLDLDARSSVRGTLGWCRGLLPVDEQAWVGFTRIRHTELRRNLSWLYHGLRQVNPYNHRPTRLALYDLTDARLLREVDTEQVGLNAIFSIHPVEPVAAR